MTWLRRWWFIIIALVTLTTAWVRLEGKVDKKADKEDVLEMRRDISEIKIRLESMDVRSRQFFCRDQPPWCR